MPKLTNEFDLTDTWFQIKIDELGRLVKYLDDEYSRLILDENYSFSQLSDFAKIIYYFKNLYNFMQKKKEEYLFLKGVYEEQIF